MSEFELPNEDDCEEQIERSDEQVGGALADGDGNEPIPNPPHGHNPK